MRYTRTVVDKGSTSVEHSLISEEVYKADLYSFKKAAEFGKAVKFSEGRIETDREIITYKVYQFGQD